ncbi:MAG: hypothetical protein HYU62_01250 [Caulobacterales bacterium]|nr:hypothetical protein [Caulobacterales bacterium]
MLALTVALIHFSLPQEADEGRLASEVYEVSANAADLTRYATACINEHATSGFLDIPTIRSADPAAGLVVATSHFSAEGLLGRDVRTTLTFEARANRFRLTYSNFQLFGEWALEWVPLSRSGNRWLRAQERVNRQSVNIANCVIAASRAGDW